MTRRRVRDEAVVLGRRELGEADRIVILLGEQTGKFSAVAPSARRSKRRFGGCLELFARIEVVATDRGRNLLRLEETSLLDAHAGIQTDLVSIAQASYLTELVSVLVREGQEVADIYRLLTQALHLLDRSPLHSLAIRDFELRLLGLSGIAPQLDACLVCGSRQASGWFFDPVSGGLHCDRCAGGNLGQMSLSESTLHLMRARQAGMNANSASKSDLIDMRRILARMIDAHVDRPLKAREFLKKIATEAASGELPAGPD